MKVPARSARWKTELSPWRLSAFASFVWVLIFLLGKKPTLRIRKENLRPEWRILKQIIILGSAPFFMSASEGVLHVCFNRQVYAYGGDIAVSAMTTLFSMFQFVLLPVEGVAQGFQPIIGYNYGSGAYHRVRATIKLAVIANSTFQQTYNSLGEGARSFFFAFSRKVILLIPLLYILPNVLSWGVFADGVFAVVLAEPISDILTALTNTIYFRHFLKKKLPTEKKAVPAAQALVERMPGLLDEPDLCDIFAVTFAIIATLTGMEDGYSEIVSRLRKEYGGNGCGSGRKETPLRLSRMKDCVLMIEWARSQ